MMMKRLSDLFLLDVNRRQNNVAGRLFSQLNDSFAQVGIDDVDPVVLEKVIQPTFLSQHRFAFDDP